MARTLVAACVTLLLGACAGSPRRAMDAQQPGAGVEKEELGGETANEFAILGCKSASQCPEATMEASATGVAGQTGILVGFKGEAVNWAFEGVDASGGSRNVGVFLLDLPAGAMPSSERVSRSISVAWTPTTVGAGPVTIKLYLRDMDRCILAEGRQICLFPKPMAQYDQPSELRYEILDRAELESAIAGQGGQGEATPSQECQQQAAEQQQQEQQQNPFGEIFGSYLIGGDDYYLQDGFDWVEWFGSIGGGSQGNTGSGTSVGTGTEGC